jgi:hypothetical protein
MRLLSRVVVVVVLSRGIEIDGERMWVEMM